MPESKKKAAKTTKADKPAKTAKTAKAEKTTKTVKAEKTAKPVKTAKAEAVKKKDLLEMADTAAEANKKWRQKNPEYSHAMERLRSKIRYWTRSSKPIAAEMVKSLKIEKRLLQMSKENRKNPMTYLPSI